MIIFLVLWYKLYVIILHALAKIFLLYSQKCEQPHDTQSGNIAFFIILCLQDYILSNTTHCYKICNHWKQIPVNLYLSLFQEFVARYADFLLNASVRKQVLTYFKSSVCAVKIKFLLIVVVV